MNTDDSYVPRHAVKDKIFLSPPDMSGSERDALMDAFDSNWIAPMGPALEQFEERLCDLSSRESAVAVNSGTSALHLGLLVLGVGPGDLVIVPSLTFVASANVVRYLGAEPVFVDCDPATGNLDPHLLETALRGLANSHCLPTAVMAVDLYGSCANYTAIEAICADYGVPIIEDAAEAIGARHGLRPAGSFGAVSAFSFNGNKLVTTGGGGALVGPSDLIAKARYFASQARSATLHFEHEDVGYGYGMSNLLAAVGSAQLDRLPAMVERTRAINLRYREILSLIPGAEMINIDREGVGNGWLSVMQLDVERHGSAHEICAAMQADGIEARPAWKPMHLQPIYSDSMLIGGEASASHFESGVCLPSGSSMSNVQQEQVISSLLTALSTANRPHRAPVTIQLPHDTTVIQLPTDAAPAHAASGQTVLGRPSTTQPAHAATSADATASNSTIQLPAPTPIPTPQPLEAAATGPSKTPSTEAKAEAQPIQLPAPTPVHTPEVIDLDEQVQRPVDVRK